ncbi:uncharacterized protein LOC124171536 isoform X2 [Ischnura elegans]|uniref:uncharacterized protein LOC124171536 isoform X2 n=1 Tax=Ischnura elegans TaxID=197161 RepID=UPI001ED89B70|nr:uncharacterized protein LOC124171536 isoform X2 [Ischnura elegans]
MDRHTTQGSNMRLPLRPAPAPPKSSSNGSNTRTGARAPLQRRLTNVGLDWDNPWSETEVNQNAVDVTSMTHSLSDLHLGNNPDQNGRKKKTPPPRPPPPRFNRNVKHNGAPHKNNHKSNPSSILAALFTTPRPARRPHKDSSHGQSGNGKHERHAHNSRRNGGRGEVNSRELGRHHPSKHQSSMGGIMKSSTSAPSMLSENHRKAESPPPLLDLLTSSPPSSPVPSSRFGGSTGADTDSLSSDGFSKVGMGNAFASAFPSDDDPFDPFGEMVNGNTPHSDPWGGEDPFSPVPAPRNVVLSSAIDDPWANTFSVSGGSPDSFWSWGQSTPAASSPSSSAAQNASSSLTSSGISTFNDPDDWPEPQQRNVTLAGVGNSIWYTGNTSSTQLHSSSSARPNVRNLNSSNGSSPSRANPSEVPRTMNLAILGAMPTIIRAKPKPKERNLLECASVTEVVSGGSPPMPSVPPPPPPPSSLLDEWDGGGEGEEPPDLPPRPWKSEQETLSSFTASDSKRSREQPHGVALFDYPATHPDDLAFQTGDVIMLIRKINDEWYQGQRENGGPPGMFPSTFIRLVVDLPSDSNVDSALESWNDSGETSASSNLCKEDRMVKALYTFKPEAPEDLEFEEGETIEVTAQLDCEWLWGCIGSRCGQFPASFVDRVPKFLPQHQ